MRRIGLYGGTFDPIHFGHLHLANEMLAHHQLDEVWFVPATISPHKLDTPPTAASHRLKMVELAIEGLDQFRLYPSEIERGGTSYTIDTVKEILNSAGGDQYFLILTDEQVPDLARWKSIEELVDLIPFLVGRRSHQHAGGSTGVPKIDAAVRQGRTEMPVLEISATTIRKRVRNNLTCRHLVPSPVLAYIYQHKLYLA